MVCYFQEAMSDATMVALAETVVGTAADNVLTETMNTEATNTTNTRIPEVSRNPAGPQAVVTPHAPVGAFEPPGRIQRIKTRTWLLLWTISIAWASQSHEHTNRRDGMRGRGPREASRPGASCHGHPAQLATHEKATNLTKMDNILCHHYQI